MKTSLAYVEEACERALSSELRVVEKIGGFTFESKTRKKDSAVKSYRHDTDELRSLLASAGVEPLATLPLEWWSKLLKETGLCSVEADQDAVSCDIEFSKRAISGVVFALGVAASIIMTIGVALATALFFSLVSAHMKRGDFVLTTIIASMFFAFPTIVFINAVASPRLIKLTAALYFLPEKRRRRAINFSGIGRRIINFSLPRPPRDFAETLVKLREKGYLHNTRYAAEFRAFQFSPSIADYAAGVINEEMKFRAEARRAALADPIAYVVMGSAVAVVGQFGDFPIEKEVVDRVTRTI